MGRSGSQPTGMALLQCFLRSYLVGAAFNTRGLQNVGFVYALEPGLAKIYTDPRELQQARKRYLRHYNTHLFWTPLLLGLFLSLEDKISKGAFGANILDNVKNTTIYTLSAIGDSVFAGSLLVFWSLSTTAFLLAGLYTCAVVWGIIWFVALHVFKLLTFIIGYKEGLKFLMRLKSWDLINWGQRLKMANGVLVAVVLYLVWPYEHHGPGWLASISLLALGAWFVAKGKLQREFVLILLLGGYLAVPGLMKLWTYLF